MRKLILIITVLLMSTVAFAENKAKTVFTLDHQMSEMCEKKIKSNLRFEKGVSSIDVSLPKNTITIAYNPEKTNNDNLLKAFKKIGFTAMVVNPENSCNKDKISDCCKAKESATCEKAKSSCCEAKNDACCKEKAVCKKK